jgi:allantoinase
VDEFPCVSPDELRAAMVEVVARCPTLPVLCHAEQCASHNHPPEEGEPSAYHSYLHSRPTRFETDAISTALRLAEETGARTHVVHLSAAEGVPLFAEARAKGLENVSVETCPHYLTLDAESIPSGATAFKCAPPIRGKANQAALWAALRAGTIPMIVSDHSPCEPSLKLLESGDFSKAWGGISSLQLGLPLIYSELRAQALAAGQSESEALDQAVAQVNQWMSLAPAKFVHFTHRKGALKVGMDGDVTFWNPSTPFLVEKAMIQHKHKLTPYLGRTLYGQVTKTFVRGIQVYENMKDGGVRFASPPIGQRVRPAEHPLEKDAVAASK